MIEGQQTKRDVALAWMVGAYILEILIVMLVQPTEKNIVPFAVLFFIIPIAAIFFWFKAFYHWSKAKGYPGGFGSIGILLFPIGPIVMACMKDQAPAPPAFDDPIRQCPECGTAYQLGDYNPDAEAILCGKCNTELPREAHD